MKYILEYIWQSARLRALCTPNSEVNFSAFILRSEEYRYETDL